MSGKASPRSRKSPLSQAQSFLRARLGGVDGDESLGRIRSSSLMSTIGPDAVACDSITMK
jgi:hypothetical protein